jgi:tRNA(Ile)-lysidine synthase
MARARDARYRALEAALRRWTERDHSRLVEAHGYIATGHHADDRAETMLMRLIRGSGPAGLAVLPARSSNLIRPLIRARRADVAAHLERHRIAYADDPTNRDPRFLRTKVRHELLPLFENMSPRIVEHLCDLAEALGESTPSDRSAVPEVLAGLRLGRAHRTELARALRDRNRAARVPLPGGRIAAIDLPSGQIVLIEGK